MRFSSGNDDNEDCFLFSISDMRGERWRLMALRFSKEWDKYMNGAGTSSEDREDKWDSLEECVKWMEERSESWGNVTVEGVLGHKIIDLIMIKYS